ncbi:uncharacterized protein BDZ99DRAFT_524316 [Mytilinidion resinicola]|uniref:Uncharacterized protein n=1 Tax=Mytilinidion resinicola TaxID=574789 RepID=A0A6A6YBM0_9PEZI|nr:uncharacterized protein BDZ99DRAFT_524316 [Mytilinidion resinicola]KAF2806090.1 hypothetical protein BDZ99DRAFT_524316 [Mytilinidion resinicola]
MYTGGCCRFNAATWSTHSPLCREHGWRKAGLFPHVDFMYLVLISVFATFGTKSLMWYFARSSIHSSPPKRKLPVITYTPIWNAKYETKLGFPIIDFRRFPREIRDMIYEYMLRESDAVELAVGTNQMIEIWGDTIDAFCALANDPETRHESCTFWMSNNKFRIFERRPALPFGATITFLLSVGNPYRNMIKSLEIRNSGDVDLVEHAVFDHLSLAFEKLSLVIDVLKHFPNLESLLIDIEPLQLFSRLVCGDTSTNDLYSLAYDIKDDDDGCSKMTRLEKTEWMENNKVLQLLIRVAKQVNLKRLVVRWAKLDDRSSTWDALGAWPIVEDLSVLYTWHEHAIQLSMENYLREKIHPCVLGHGPVTQERALVPKTQTGIRNSPGARPLLERLGVT